MNSRELSLSKQAFPAPSAVLELFKPITWFPPMWAFACGVVSSGMALRDNWVTLILGILLTGPLVCATSQAVNDWFDRHVDAINEPNRPIPSGRVPGRWGLYIGIIWSIVSLLVAAYLGVVVFCAAIIGLVLAWAYSAPPFRLKQNAWYGYAACGACYEGLPWITGAAVMLAGAVPDAKIFAAAILYSVGAHGIMTLNDFKAVEGDKATGLKSLPVTMGVDGAARFACRVMAAPQIVMIALLAYWQQPVAAALVSLSLALQILCMRRFVGDPLKYAPWYNATGVTLYVIGMMVTAVALRSAVVL
ncbi:chlorophyll synthase ChlG [Granulosicoccus sp.]|nr:chlorophyll synthase ChlG [Granulosicoccus sp.]